MMNSKEEAICGWCGKHLGIEYKGLQIFCCLDCSTKFTIDENAGEYKNE